MTKAMVTYAAEHKTTVQEMLKKGFLIAVEKGILDEYTPLAVCSDAELLSRWLAEKIETRNILRKHIEAGELVIRKRTEKESRKDMLYSKNLYDGELEAARKILESVGLKTTEKGEIDEKIAFEKFEGDVITGESVYDLKADYEFVKRFKERVDKYDPNLGIVYADSDSEQNGDHLDQELLICGLNSKGEPDVFSLYGLSMTKLSALLEINSFFKEETKDGKIYLKFKNPELEIASRSRRQSLIDNYTRLIALQDIFERVGKIYETDLTHHVAERLSLLREYIEQNNKAIRIATNTDEETNAKKYAGFFRRGVLEIRDGLFIDIEAIQPDTNAVEEHELKLKKILGEF